MGQLRDSGFVRLDDIEFSAVAGTVRVRGEISCLGDIVISVDKVLEVLDPGAADPRVQTLVYSYNASVRGAGSFLRHDNAHAHPGHEDKHHRHELDWRTGEAIRAPEWCGAEGWPTLGDFIETARRWYYEHFDELPAPDRCATLTPRDARR